MAEMVDFYKLLNLDSSVSLEELKADMFKKKKLKTNQASSAPTPERRREAEDFLKFLDEARKVFESEATRNAYDSKLADHKKRQEADFEQYNKKMAEMQDDTPRGADPAALMEEANKAIAAKNYQSAIIALQKILSVAPEAFEPRKQLVKVYYEWGSDIAIDAAVRELAFLEMNPNLDYETYLYSGRIYAKMDEWDKSINAYQKAVQLAHGELEPSMELAQIFLESDRVDEAITLYEDMIHSEKIDEYVLDDISFDLSSCYVLKALNEGTVVLEDHPLMEPGVYITEESQVTNMRKYLERVRRLCPDHPGIADLEGCIEFAMQRRFMGSKAAPIIAGILGVLLISGPGIILLLSAALYAFGSRQRQYRINRRVLIGDVGGGLDGFLSHMTSNDGGLVGLLIGVGIVVLLLPVIAIVNTVNNYAINK